ncbi:MAG: Gfo/Idh/MocA family oxidoreductase [Ramlibacter sp.]|nr:Gfo/Idh/MocA family oxidoreductase [Cryobacterium sp.]
MPKIKPAVAPIRTGLIGFGTSGRVFHSPFLAANPDFSLDLIVTRDPARLELAAERYPQARLVPAVDDLVAAADDLDLVVIGSPSGTHVELAHAALDAGLAVVVDKPFAVTTRQGRGLIEKAARLGLLLTVFQNRRWDGDFLTLRGLVAAGALGEVRRFESRFEWWKPEQAKSWKATATIAEGGGILFDLGAHLIDQALQLFGPVDDVYAETMTRRPGGTADDDTFVSLHHGSGVRSHLWMNGLAAQVGPRFHVLGADAGFTKWGLDGQEAALKAGARPTDADFGLEPESTWGVLGRDGALTRVPTERGAYGTFYAALADALLRGGPAPVDPEDALRVISIIERVNLLTH